MVDINIIAQNGVCTEFKGSTTAAKEEVSIVIAPTKVLQEADGKIKVVTGCNMWQGCFNAACYYSMAARDNSKHHGKEVKRP